MGFIDSTFETPADGKQSVSSRAQELDREWPFWNLKQGELEDATRISKFTLASKLASVLADRGAQHHPLETTEEDQDSDSDSDLVSNSEAESESDKDSRRDAITEKSDNVESLPNTDEGFERILQRLERIEGSVKDLKSRVDNAKLRIEQSAHELGTAEPDRDPIAKAVPSLAPSLSSAVMEKMAAMASPELPHSWSKKLDPKPAVKPIVASEPVMEERDLRYSALMVKSDCQDVLSFRRWEQEVPKPKPKRRSKEFDLEAALDRIADEYANSKDLKLPLLNFKVPAPWEETKRDNAPSKHDASATTNPSLPHLEPLSNLKTCDDRRAKPKVDVEVVSQPEDFNPSPCSFTCGHSPTSLFSDDIDPFQMGVSGDETVFVTKKCQPLSGDGKSPRSVLSAQDEEPDETSRSVSESSETPEDDRHTICRAYLYNDDSSDLESPMQAKNVGLVHQPFPTFTYNVGEEMGETSSEEDQDESTPTTSAELESFHDAATRWGPSRPAMDGDRVSEDSVLKPLLSPASEPKEDATTSMIAHRKESSPPSQEANSNMVEQKTVQESPSSPKTWVPYVTGNNNNNASPIRTPVKGEEGLPEKKRPPKRSVNFAPDLVREIPHSPDQTPDKQPAYLSRAKPTTMQRHGAEPVVFPEPVASPGIAKWQVEEGPSIMTSRRLWRRNREDDATEALNPGESSSWDARSGSRRQRLVQAVPCAGKLLSWSQRLAFKVSSRGRGAVESDEEGCAEDRSFGRSARRDAEQVRRILKGNQKKYSNLSVAEIMREDFLK